MTKPRKQTSSTISSLAGKYARMTNAEFVNLIGGLVLYPGGGWDAWEKHRNGVFRDIRKMAASLLSQDETKGQAAKHRSGK